MGLILSVAGDGDVRVSLEEKEEFQHFYKYKAQIIIPNKFVLSHIS
jgi:hypothetical protein